MKRPNWLNPWMLVGCGLLLFAVQSTTLVELRLIAGSAVFVCGWVGGQLAVLSPSGRKDP